MGIKKIGERYILGFEDEEEGRRGVRRRAAESEEKMCKESGRKKVRKRV
jgi:hypothetical protein